MEAAESRTRPTISVCIICRNEADKLPECLDSVRWADEVVVMDLESTDGSADVARAFGATVVSHEPIPIVEPLRNAVASHASGDWILALDPDERVSPGLAEELRRVAGLDVDAVEIPVMNFDFGHPAVARLHRHDPKPRFYRPRRVTWPEQPNKLPVIQSDRVLKLPLEDRFALVHDRNRTVAEAIERVLRYAPAEAQAMIDAGERFTARRMLAVLAGKTHKQLIVGRALHEGVPGLVRTGVLVSFHFYVWAAFWQLSGAKRREADDRFLATLGRFLDAGWRGARIGRGVYRKTRALLRNTRR